MRVPTYLLLVTLLVALPSGAPRAQSFTDVTAPAGLTYLQHAARVPPDCFLGAGTICEPERMTGGAAVADVDGDGWLDLFVTRLDGPDMLFRNQGDGTFGNIAGPAGLLAFDLQSNGAAFADIDNDGDADLYVTTHGDAVDSVNQRNYLFINDGTGRFSEQALWRGAAMRGLGRRIGFSVAFGDFDRDGWLDIHVTEWQPPTVPHARLLRNLGSAAPGHFEDLTDVAGVELDDVYGFSSAFSDLDGDGWPDLAVTADFGSSRLFWNDADGTFTDGTGAAGVGTDENGMGSTVGDFDGDGDLDWFVTSIFDAQDTCNPGPCNWGASGNRLYLNEGGRSFADATDAFGVRDGGWGWGAACIEFDNDGDLDLVMTNGVDFARSEVETPFHDDPMRLWRNDGMVAMGEVAAAAGLTDTGSGKGLLQFDYDRDGDVDLFVVNNAASGRLFRNDGGNSGDWLRVSTVGLRSNRDGIGARIFVEEPAGTIQLREIGSASHFLGQGERTAHFGLGGEGPVQQVTVHWPSGVVQQLVAVARNTTLVLLEPACVDEDDDGYCTELDCDDTNAGVHPGQGERCGNGTDDNCNLVTDEAGCFQPVGSVPDGATVPGQPLTVLLEADGDLTLSWDDDCSATATDYAVYRGNLAAFGTQAPLTCGTGGATEYTFTPAASDGYYLVVATRGVLEGSYGTKSGGAERERDYPTACRVRAVQSCE